ncbi:hypothetical protein MMC08_003755 [Hypocenomyce scalaris]|nr:hypothetical protein [Hypocenomyce scalaris]
MPSPLVTATIQACLLNITSSILAQLLTSYRTPTPFPSSSSHYNPLSLDPTPIIHFLIYTLLSTPVNFLFQQFLESALPAYPINDPKATKVKIDDGGKGVIVEKKLNVRNTVLKVLADQTVAAGMNTVGFLGVIPALRGASMWQVWEGIKLVS